MIQPLANYSINVSAQDAKHHAKNVEGAADQRWLVGISLCAVDYTWPLLPFTCGVDALAWLRDVCSSYRRARDYAKGLCPIRSFDPSFDPGSSAPV